MQENVRDVVRFCVRENIVLMADEVYQENVYAEGKKFVSFKKAKWDLGNEAAGLELFSFHSVSKVKINLLLLVVVDRVWHRID